MTGFTLANPIVGSADLKNIMQVEFHPLKMTSRGRCSNLRSFQPEMRRVGLNGNLNNHEVGDCVGWENEATLRPVGPTGWKRPSEGAKRRYPPHFLSKLTDADGELQETIHGFNRAAAYGDSQAATKAEWEIIRSNIGGKLGTMMQKLDSFC